MAVIDTNGLDALIIDLDQIEEIDDGTMLEMLEAGGDVIKKGHDAAMEKLFKHQGGNFHGSSEVIKKLKMSKNSKYIVVYPTGEHHQAKSTGKITYNNDIGFVHELGGHGNEATEWMRLANEQHIDEAVDAEYEVYDKWLGSHNL